VRNGSALFSGGLRNVFSLADLKMNRLLEAFDEWAATTGAGVGGGGVARPPPPPPPAPQRDALQSDESRLRARASAL
jgi:putative flavoprotein involved in K+ transport